MIGNDIIDLSLAAIQNNWRRKGWLQKIFTLDEQARIWVSENPDQTVWTFWSRKEAAYKAHQRQFCLSPRLNPKAIECLDNRIVTIESHYFYTKTILTKLYCYTEAFSNKWTKADSRICKGEKNNASQLLLSRLSEINKIPPEQLYILKDRNNIPQICVKDYDINYHFSLTHHGSFSAYTILSEEL